MSLTKVNTGTTGTPIPGLDRSDNGTTVTALEGVVSFDNGATPPEPVRVSAANPLPALVADGNDVALGAKADAPVVDPALSASAVALLKGVLTQLLDLVATSPALVGGNVPVTIAGQTGTPSVSVTNLPTTQPVSGTVSVSNFPATQPVSGTVGVTGTFWQTTQPVSGTFWQTTQPISAAALPLPTGAATDANLVAIKNAIQAQIDLSTSVWTDNSGAYYVRRDSVNESTGTITVSFTDATGTTATPGAGLRPLATADKDVVQALYDAIAGGTGYSSGDLLARVGIYNADTGTAVFIWMNLTTGAVMGTPPSAGNIQKSEEVVTSRLADGLGNLITSAVRGSERPLSVQVVDASGNQIASFGGGTLNAAGSSAASTNAKRTSSATPIRTVTANDLVATPTTPTQAGVTVSGGTLAFGTSYAVAVAGRTDYGVTVATATGVATPGGSNNGMRVAIPTLTNAKWVDVFLGTNTAGLPQVATFTAAQVAAGGAVCTSPFTVTTGGSAPAGSVDIGVVGTGQNHNSTDYGVNNAYVLPGTGSAITCDGNDNLWIFAEMTISDRRTAPAASIILAFKHPTSTNWSFTDALALPMSGVVGGSLNRLLKYRVGGAVNILPLVINGAGQGWSLALYWEKG